MNIGAGEGLVIVFILTLGLIPIVLGIMVAVDASKYPDAAFDRAGTSKTLWIVLPLVGIVVCGVATIIAAILWYSSYKPKIAAAAGGASPY